MTLQVFISYKSEYRDFARAVKNELNQWGFQSWLDVDNIQPGDYFRHKIQQGLDSSDILLMVLTEEAQLSREVMAEVDYFLDVAKKPVVPLRHRECKPLYIFVSIQYIDFVEDQANGFVRLKQRLNELAAGVQKAPATTEEIGVVPQSPGGLAIPDAFDDGMATEQSPEKQASTTGNAAPPPRPGSSSEPEPMPSDDRSKEESKKRSEPLSDWLQISDDEPAVEAEASRPQPIFASPTSPIVQPQRQAEYMPQPASRRKASPVIWPLATAAGLVIIVGAVLLLNSNTTLINTSQEPRGISPLVWIGVLAILGAGGFVFWRRLRQPTFGAIPSTSSTDTNNRREDFKDKTEDFWMTMLLGSQPATNLVETGLAGAVLRHKDYGDYPLPAASSSLAVFNDLNRELLILGSPDNRKKLLLQLQREIVPLARQGLMGIPVVLHLSSWKANESLTDWLTKMLMQRYQMPESVASMWVQGDKLLLLLDGLDTMANQDRSTCIEAINRYRQEHPKVDLAICGRADDYEYLTSQFDMRGAITLQ